jgi:hypothetical protein
VVCADAVIDASSQQKRTNIFLIASVDSYSKTCVVIIVFQSRLAPQQNVFADCAAARSFDYRFPNAISLRARALLLYKASGRSRDRRSDISHLADDMRVLGRYSFLVATTAARSMHGQNGISRILISKMAQEISMA